MSATVVCPNCGMKRQLKGSGQSSYRCVGCSRTVTLQAGGGEPTLQSAQSPFSHPILAIDEVTAGMNAIDAIIESRMEQWRLTDSPLLADLVRAKSLVV